jgi:hypothetical protein
MQEELARLALGEALPEAPALLAVSVELPGSVEEPA